MQKKRFRCKNQHTFFLLLICTYAMGDNKRNHRQIIYYYDNNNNRTKMLLTVNNQSLSEPERGVADPESEAADFDLDLDLDLDLDEDLLFDLLRERDLDDRDEAELADLDEPSDDFFSSSAAPLSSLPLSAKHFNSNFYTFESK